MNLNFKSWIWTRLSLLSFRVLFHYYSQVTWKIKSKIASHQLIFVTIKLFSVYFTLKVTIEVRLFYLYQCTFWFSHVCREAYVGLVKFGTYELLHSPMKVLTFQQESKVWIKKQSVCSYTHRKQLLASDTTIKLHLIIQFHM